MTNSKKLVSFILFFILGVVIPTVSNAKEYPKTITVIYLKDGTVIDCDMGWIEGDTLHYRKYGGTISMPLKTVDIERTYKKSIEKEESNKIIYLRDGTVIKCGDVLIRFFKVRKPKRVNLFFDEYKLKLWIGNYGPSAIIKVIVEAFTSDGKPAIRHDGRQLYAEMVKEIREGDNPKSVHGRYRIYNGDNIYKTLEWKIVNVSIVDLKTGRKKGYKPQE